MNKKSNQILCMIHQTSLITRKRDKLVVPCLQLFNKPLSNTSNEGWVRSSTQSSTGRHISIKAKKYRLIHFLCYELWLCMLLFIFMLHNPNVAKISATFHCRGAKNATVGHFCMLKLPIVICPHILMVAYDVYQSCSTSQHISALEFPYM